MPRQLACTKRQLGESTAREGPNGTQSGGPTSKTCHFQRVPQQRPVFVLEIGCSDFYPSKLMSRRISFVIRSIDFQPISIHRLPIPNPWGGGRPCVSSIPPTPGGEATCSTRSGSRALPELLSASPTQTYASCLGFWDTTWAATACGLGSDAARKGTVGWSTVACKGRGNRPRSGWVGSPGSSAFYLSVCLLPPTTVAAGTRLDAVGVIASHAPFGRARRPPRRRRVGGHRPMSVAFGLAATFRCHDGLGALVPCRGRRAVRRRDGDTRRAACGPRVHDWSLGSASAAVPSSPPPRRTERFTVPVWHRACHRCGCLYGWRRWQKRQLRRRCIGARRRSVKKGEL